MTDDLRLSSAAATHVGLIRSGNEDAHAARDADRLWLVADGMGGHAHGEWAAATIAARFSGVAADGGFDAVMAGIDDAIRTANDAIWRQAVERMTQMGSTAVALHLAAGRAGIVWVGDSRAYRLRGDTLTQLSRDHSQVQYLVDNGLIAPHEAHRHPQSHVLARAVGVREQVEIDRLVTDAQAGDRFLLCSDGLSGPVDAATIAALLADRTPDAAVSALVAAALAAGGPDNITAIAIAIDG